MPRDHINYDATNDYYNLLGISPDSSIEEIQTAFRQKAKQIHPDINRSDPSANSKFQLLNDARSILTDTISRNRYDKARQKYHNTSNIKSAPQYKRQTATSQQTKRSTTPTKQATHKTKKQPKYKTTTKKQPKHKTASKKTKQGTQPSKPYVNKDFVSIRSSDFEAGHIDLITYRNMQSVSFRIHVDELVQILPQLPKLEQAKTLNMWIYHSSKDKQFRSYRIYDEIFSARDTTELFKILSQLKTLAHLEIHGLLSHIPDNINRLENLQSIRFFDSAIKTIPTNIAKLKHLTELEISKSQINRLPIRLAKSRSLKDINLSDNDITSVPRSWGYMDSLESLNIRNNNISYLPLELGRLKHSDQYSAVEAYPYQTPEEEVYKNNISKYLHTKWEETPPIRKTLSLIYINVQILGLDIIEETYQATINMLRKIPPRLKKPIRQFLRTTHNAFIQWKTNRTS